MTMAAVARGNTSRLLWAGMWLSFAVLVATLGVDAWVRQVPVVWGVLWFLPLAILVPGMARDHLRTIAWFCLVMLMYFVFSVLRIFAEPDSPRAIAELASVILVFVFSMFYIRQRGRELRAAREPVAKE